MKSIAKEPPSIHTIQPRERVSAVDALRLESRYFKLRKSLEKELGERRRACTSYE